MLEWGLHGGYSEPKLQKYLSSLLSPQYLNSLCYFGAHSGLVSLYLTVVTCLTTVVTLYLAAIPSLSSQQ